MACHSLAEPLARLLLHLASSPTTQQHFVRGGFVPSMVDKVWAPMIGEHTSELLAAAVHHTVDCSQSGNQGFSFILSDKLCGGVAVHAGQPWAESRCAAANHLQESLQRIRLQESMQTCY